jgi:TIR domain
VFGRLVEVLKRPRKLFISYAHRDETWCSEFVEALKEQQIDVWFDRHEVDVQLVGDDLQQALAAAIANCDLIVMIYSSVSRTSPWVAWELLQRNDKMCVLILHDAPVGRVGAFLRSWANYGVYDAGHLSGAATAHAFLHALDKLQQVADDILQGVRKADARADALWQLSGYKKLTDQSSS